MIYKARNPNYILFLGAFGQGYKTASALDDRRPASVGCVSGFTLDPRGPGCSFVPSPPFSSWHFLPASSGLVQSFFKDCGEWTL